MKITWAYTKVWGERVCVCVFVRKDEESGGVLVKKKNNIVNGILHDVGQSVLINDVNRHCKLCTASGGWRNLS